MLPIEVRMATLINLPLYNEIVKSWRPATNWSQLMMVIDSLRVMKVGGRVYGTYDQIFNILNAYHPGPLTNAKNVCEAIDALARKYNLIHQAEAMHKQFVIESIKQHYPLTLEDCEVSMEEMKIKPVKKHVN